MSDQNDAAANDASPGEHSSHDEASEAPAFEVPAPSAAPAPPAVPLPPVAPVAGAYAVPAPSAPYQPNGVPAAPYQPGPAAVAAAPAAPFLSPDLVAALLRGLVTAGIAVGATIAAGGLLAVLILTSYADQLGTAGVPLPEGYLDAFNIEGSSPIFLAFVLAGAVLGGRLGIGLAPGGDSGGFDFSFSGGLSMFPLTFTVLVLVLVLWWSLRQARKAPVTRILDRVVLSVVVGLVVSLVMLALTLIFTFRFSVNVSMFATFEGHISGASFLLVLWGTLLVGGTVFLGTQLGSTAEGEGNWLRVIGRALASSPRGLRETLGYGTLLAAVFGVGVLVLAVISTVTEGSPAPLLWGLAGLLNAAPFVAVIGHLGGIASDTSALAGVSGSGSAAQTLTLFSEGNGTFWLFFVLAVLFSLFIATWLGVRRPRVVGFDLRSSWQFPLFALIGWILFSLLFFGLSMTISVDASGTSFGGIAGQSAALSIGVAWWSFFVLLLWILLIEAGAQFLPTVLYGLSPQLLSFVGGRASAARWLQGTPVPAAAGDAQAAAASPSAAPGYAVPPAPGYGVPPAPGAYAAGAAPYVGAVPAPGGGLIAPPAPGSSPAAAGALPAPKPLSPRAKKGLIWGAAGVVGVGLLIAAAAITVNVLNSSRTAEGVAREYLQQIADGHAEAASALVDPNIPDDQRAYLTDEVLQGASKRISDFDVEVQELYSGQDETYLAVTYKLDGVSYEASLTAEKGDPEWLFLDTWKLTSSLVTQVRLSVSGEGEVTIGGVPVELSGDGSSYTDTEITVYPAVYEVAGDAGEFFASDPVQVTAANEFTDSSYAYLEFAATPALTDAVEEQVKGLIDECAKSTEAEPEDCPFYTYIYDEVPVTWAVSSYPTVEVTSQGTGFYAQGGEMTATYIRTLYDGEQREETREVSVYLSGDITISGDKVTLDY